MLLKQRWDCEVLLFYLQTICVGHNTPLPYFLFFFFLLLLLLLLFIYLLLLLLSLPFSFYIPSFFSRRFALTKDFQFSFFFFHDFLILKYYFGKKKIDMCKVSFIYV